MEQLYNIAGTSRQAFHAWMKPSKLDAERTTPQEVLKMAKTVRKEFLPGSSARELYFYIRNKHPTFSTELIGWGKHNFEQLCLNNGFRVVARRFVPKTTDSKGVEKVPNHVEGLIINDINRVWVSDISYIYCEHYHLIGYATALIDVYSRRLLGLSFSKTMHAAVTVHPVLKQALTDRSGMDLSNTFFHADGGKQFIEKMFRKMLDSRGITLSMAYNCFENSFAESFNDTLKNHLMHDSGINSFNQLKSQEQFIKNCYNFNKPHNSINRLTPVEYEQHLLTLQPSQRTPLLIKSWVEQ